MWRAAEPPAEAVELAAAGYPPPLAVLLARRGVATPAVAEAFLRPAPDQLHPPRLLAGMDRAVAALLRARERGSPVAVVADYDVDGVTSAALLLAVFRACGLAAEAILPHRLREGYGFQEVHVERACELGAGLIVTADCGATANAAAVAALASGLELVVTDHHLPGAPLPPEVAFVNPRQASCSYPFPDLAGVGLALKLALACAEACGRRVDLEPLLRVACLGTIADLVPLTGENRTIAALGLAALAHTRSPGLRALAAAAGVRPPYRAADVGFRLGPRLNAAGRLESAEAALELLLCRDPERARALAARLEAANRERQAEERRVTHEARAQIRGRGELPPLLVAWDSGWHRGVVGIAAARLARELARPTVLLATDGELATGSGRSAAGVDLHTFLSRWHDELERFGGHAQAIGLTVRSDRLEALRARWEAAAFEFGADVGRICHQYELDLDCAAANAELLATVERLAPCGAGNPEPLVRVGPLRALGAPRRFGEGHLALTATGPRGGLLRLVGWGFGERAALFGGSFEVLGHLERDRRTGGPALRLLDARPARDAAAPAPRAEEP